MFSLILTLVGIGALWFLVNTLPFIESTMKTIINVIIFIVVIVWLGRFFFGAHVIGIR